MKREIAIIGGGASGFLTARFRFSDSDYCKEKWERCRHSRKKGQSSEKSAYNWKWTM